MGPIEKAVFDRTLDLQKNSQAFRSTLTRDRRYLDKNRRWLKRRRALTPHPTP